MNLFRALGAAFLLFSGALAYANGDQQYDQALASIEAGDYSSALAQLRRLQREYPGFKKLAAAQTRIAVLQESADAGDSLPVFLRALTLRDEGRILDALAELAVIASAFPAGALTDDALYISAYLQVMDRYDFSAARESLATLQQRFPESAYSDSAQYLDAIAMEQLGDTQGARQALIELRERHTALSLPLEFRWPAGSVLSRYWFNRAHRRLAIVEERIAIASTVDAKEEQVDGRLRLAVNVEGVDMRLLLVPSPLTRTTKWLDAALDDQAPPSIGIFDGVVEGVYNSWVRAVLQDGSLSGVVNINGVQQRLTPANLMGTLDYYQPRSRKNIAPGGKHSDLADSLQGLDALVAPPVPMSGFSSRTRSVQTDVRAVPVSIVVDSQYDRYYGGAGLANALNNLNVADGVYRQFGLALTVDEALKFSDDADPLRLGAVPLETILRSFRDYRLRYKTLFEDSALSYLFTGNPKTDVTLGLAWIGTACRLDGYDVGVTTPSSFGDVLLTHELGHSFGAQHDSDTQCSDDQSAVMWPNISERTKTTFSSCSRQSVVTAKEKSCLKNTVDLTVSAGTTGSSVSFSVFNADSALTLDAQLVVETSAPDQLRWPAGCRAQTPTSANCRLSALGPRENRVLDFTVTQAFQNTDAPVTAQVSPVNALELQLANNMATVSLIGGSSSEHLTIATEPAGYTSLPNAEQSGTPVAGAATSGGSLSRLVLYVMFVLSALRLVLITRNGHRTIGSAQESSGSS
ncbi:MAG: M12 family metallo-peptidase [Granulosicoccus sp.]